jgi:hypothetical protein
MPRPWLSEAESRLRRFTKRHIVIRRHPGREKLDPDFTNVWAVVTWGSGAAIKALAAGVPVFYEMPNWIGGDAAIQGVDRIETPWLGDRLPMFRRLAWAQYRLSEIEKGWPFAALIEMNNVGFSR